MASIKVKFNPSTVADREGTIYYLVIHERKSREIFSGHHVFPSEWDARHSDVRPGRNQARLTLIHSVREQIRRDVERLTRIIRKFEYVGHPYTAADVSDIFRRQSEICSLSNFMTGIIARLKNNGRIRTSETYTAAMRSFRKFLKSRPYPTADIPLDCLDSATMEAYEAWLKERGNCPNTISFYNRILRAVYNRALDEDLIDNRHPFRHVYTGIDRTVKRALPIPTLSKIKALDLSRNPSLDFARDMFLMSFMFRGMSFIDMALLKKSDLNGGYISYRRRKTGQLLTVKWTNEMQSILEKYPRNSGRYLLPIIPDGTLKERSAFRNAGYKINRNLKLIARMLDIPCKLTLYVARHSWASAAQSKGIPLSVISKGMGHEREATTQIYLSEIQSSVVDNANSIILSSL